MTHQNYGKPGDIWGLGIILAEMMACSSVYHQNDGYNPNRRYLFRGKECYPFSPEGKDFMGENDQIVKILERYKNMKPETDFSYLTGETK
jgi:hypothetical protein